MSDQTTNDATRTAGQGKSQGEGQERGQQQRNQAARDAQQRNQQRRDERAQRLGEQEVPGQPGAEQLPALRAAARQVDGQAVASAEENAGLEHSQGGETTRSDVLDLGVPMLPGDPFEPQGPEDALGAGPKRGDYRSRLGDTNYHPHTSEPILDALPGEPNVRLVAQRPRAEEIGEEAGLKGGVETDPYLNRAGRPAGRQVE